MAKKKLVTVQKEHIKHLATTLAERDTKIHELRTENTAKDEFIVTVAALLGVQQRDTETGAFRAAMRRQEGYTFRDNILRALTELKMEFAREDEGSQIEAEKASLLSTALQAALHDTVPGIEAAAKIKFLDMFKEAKDIRPLMDIARSFGVYPRENREYNGDRPWMQ